MASAPLHTKNPAGFRGVLVLFKDSNKEHSNLKRPQGAFLDYL